MNEMDEKKIRDTVSFYDRFSQNYDRKLDSYLNHTHERLLHHLGDVSGERILDISCGTGRLAEQIMNRFADIDLVLNDPSDGMRVVAEARLKGKMSVEFTDHIAEEFLYEKNSFDRVICLISFHYYADQQKAIQRMHNVLKPGGTLHMLDWNREGWFRLPNYIISTLSRENINARSLSEMKDMLQNNDFEVQFETKWSYRFWKFYLVEAKKEIEAPA